MIGALCNSARRTTRDEAVTKPGRWQLSIGYRWQKSFRHFVGTVEQKQRELQHTEIVNRIHLFDLAVSYQATPRWSFAFAAPFMAATRTQPGTLQRSRGIANAPDQVFHSAGVGDISLGARVWLWRPPTESRSNIAIGFALKLPTGTPGVTDSVATIQGPVTRVADQSIQLGDGGLGFSLDAQAYKSVQKATLFFFGTYLFNPRNTNGVLTGRSRPSEAVMSVPDQYLFRAGVAYPFPKIRGLAINFGGRIEGVPVRDAFGSSEGFRRPGYAISVEPGLYYTRGRNTWSLNSPVAVERNRRRSVPDIQDSTRGDAAFADYLILVGYSRRF